MAAKTSTKAGDTRKYERKSYTPLDLKELSARKANTATVNSLRRTRGERDAEQKAIDTLVESVYQDWLDSGKPETWDDVAKNDGKGAIHVTVPDSQMETLVYRVRLAGNFLHMSVRFGKIEKADGYASTIFRVCDPKPRAKK